MSAYRDNIMQKIGGQSQFRYILMTYCESIRRDSNLKVFFVHLTLEGLMELQSELLDAAFLDLPQAETETLVGRLMVKYQMLWEMGVNETHFEQLKTFLVMALHECWAENDVIQLVQTHFERLRPLFQQSVKFSPTVRTTKSLHRISSPHHQRT